MLSLINELYKQNRQDIFLHKQSLGYVYKLLKIFYTCIFVLIGEKTHLLHYHQFIHAEFYFTHFFLFEDKCVFLHTSMLFDVFLRLYR